MDNPTDNSEGKLGRGFASADKLEEVDVGDTSKKRPMFVSSSLDPDFRVQLVDLQKEFKDCFAWDYTEMPGLDRSIVEVRILDCIASAEAIATRCFSPRRNVGG